MSPFLVALTFLGNRGHLARAIEDPGAAVTARKGALGLGTEVTRRKFLQVAGAGAAWIALGTTLGCERTGGARAIASSTRGEQLWAFGSRPEFSPPAVKVRTQARATAPGYIFVSPKKEPGATGPSQDAPLIVDDSGQPVWFHPLREETMDAFNFEVQTYKGETVLTWWSPGGKDTTR